MKLAFILWLANILPQSVADPLCLTTTIYLEARDQPLAGQRAVAEVALRRTDSGLWGDSVCAVVTARQQFAPGIVNPGMRIKNPRAWAKSARIAFAVMANWARPASERQEIVPGASHFVALDKASPAWATQTPVATIGDHSFYRLQKLAP